MILSKKIQIELNKKQFLIISTLLGVIDFELNSMSSETNYPTQSVFYKDEIERIGGKTLKLAYRDSIKERLRKELEIYDNYLFITNPVINQIDNIVKVKLLSFIEKKIEILLLYEVEVNQREVLDNRFLSVYLAEYEPITAFDSGNGNCFVEGLDYLEQLFYFVDEIERLNNIRKIQEHCEKPKPTKRIQRLIEKSDNVLMDIIHKLSRKITNYCVDHKISTVLIGKAKNITVFPIRRFINQLKYKLKLEGIKLVIFGNSGKKLNIEKISEESQKLERKVKQEADWGVVAKKNRDAAFRMLTDYIDSKHLELNLPSFVY